MTGKDLNDFNKFKLISHSMQLLR